MNLIDLWKGAKYSAEAYSEPQDIYEQYAHDKVRCFAHPKADCQGFIVQDGDQIFISIRGTEALNLEDWKTNIDCAFTHCKFGKCHRGFRKDALAVYPLIDVILKDFPEKDLYIVGHSQGAAVAKQISLIFLENNIPVYRSIGYGEPRNIHKDMANIVDEKFPGIFHRVVNNNDIVTRIPRRYMGYKHFGQLHYFFEDGGYTTSLTAWQRFKDRVYGHLADIGEVGLDSVKDHKIEEYMRIITNAV